MVKLIRLKAGLFHRLPSCGLLGCLPRIDHAGHHLNQPRLIFTYCRTDTELLDQFRSYYDIDATVNIVGPFTGNLNNGGERVQLFRPDLPPLNEPDFIPLLLEDEVEYGDVAPWPADADSGIYSLSRQQNLDWGNDPVSWLALPPTGTVFTPLGTMAKSSR